MKRRYTLENDRLVDRHGDVLGRIVGITIETSPNVGAGGSRSSRQERLEETSPRDGGAGEGDDEARAEHAQLVRLAVEAEIAAVWEHYVAVMKPRKRELDAEGRKIIVEALKVASEEECCRAIDGCAASPYHMGQNARRRKYNRLSQILKARRAGQYGQAQTTRERIDFFLDLAEKSGLPSGVTSGDPARLRSAKLEVFAAWEYPGDETVVRRGEEAAAWLEQQGIRVLEDPSETNRLNRPKPRFEAIA